MIFDAVVVGAGPAGSTLARCLAREGMSVLLIDKEPVGRSRACGGFLGPEVRPLLMELGLDDMDSKIEHYSIPNVKVSGMGEISFKTALTHGWGMAVSRSQFDAFLVGHAQRSGVSVHAPSTLMSSSLKDERWSLEIADGLSMRTVQCRFLIYATGRRTYAKKKAWFAHSSFYACKATYQQVDGLSDEVVLHFVRKGHVGLNPLGNGAVTLCLYTDEANIKGAKGDLDRMMSDFMKQNSHLERHLRGAEAAAARVALLLALQLFLLLLVLLLPSCDCFCISLSICKCCLIVSISRTISLLFPLLSSLCCLPPHTYPYLSLATFIPSCTPAV